MALPFIAATGIAGSVLMMAFSLIGCGSSHNSEPLLTGIFVDDVVEGLEYRAGDRVGYTDSQGKFYYRVSETVSFYVGGIKIGETSEAKELTTPIDLVDEDNSFVLHPTVTNICRFLQTLDEDGDPDNGIRITKETRDSIQATGSTLNFSDGAFESQANSILSEAGLSSLKSSIVANKHFFKSLAKRLATPAVMINLGDSLTTGAQSGFYNAHSSTQINGFTANVAFQLLSLSEEFVWQNPLLSVNSEEYDLANHFKRKYYRSKDDETAEAVTDMYLTPYNLGIPGATTESLIHDPTTNTEFNLMDELLRPIPELAGDDPNTVNVERQELSQLEAALYVAKLDENKPRLKIFTLWVGMEDTLGVMTQNLGSGLTEANINAFLDSHNLASVTTNIDNIVNQLSNPAASGVEYGQVFIATIPRVESLGMVFGRDDIERMALFDDPDVSASLGLNEFIGYQPFVGNFESPDPETSISMALNDDNATLNAKITQVKLEDGNWLSEAERNLINARIDAINTHIRGLANASEDDNIFLVDVDTEIYQKLDDSDGEGNYGLNIASFRPDDDNQIDETLAAELNLDLYVNKTIGGGFYSLDGYHPGHIGYACIGFLFMNKIQNAGIGFDLEATYTDPVTEGVFPAFDTEITDILVFDLYNFDQDADQFGPSIGYASFGTEENNVHAYDAITTGGWIDCNDTDETILPFFVAGKQLGEGDEEDDGPCYYIVPDYTE